MVRAFRSLAAFATSAGPIEEIERTRIGASRGFANDVYRVRIRTTAGPERSVIIKCGKRDPQRREAAALAELRVGLDAELARSLPSVLGHTEDGHDSELILDDLGHLRAGGPGEPKAPDGIGQVVRFLAALHADVWRFGEVGRSVIQAWDVDRWRSRIDVASSRYPFVAVRADELIAWLPEANAAAERLAAAPSVRLHGDVHFDNLLWRRDGSLVVLDWEAACNGPAAVDLAPIVFDDPASDPSDVIDRYLREATRFGATSSNFDRQVHDALRVLCRATIGFAGRTDIDRSHPRFDETRARGARNSLAWMHRLG
jgi:hypothetical protein